LEAIPSWYSPKREPKRFPNLEAFNGTRFLKGGFDCFGRGKEGVLGGSPFFWGSPKRVKEEVLLEEGALFKRGGVVKRSFILWGPYNL